MIINTVDAAAKASHVSNDMRDALIKTAANLREIGGGAKRVFPDD